MTDAQKRTAQAMVNIFETGRAAGDYGRVTVAAGDTGHLTYGRSQTTLASGNLYLLIQSYCRQAGATLGTQLSSYLDRMKNADLTLDNDMQLRMLLKEAGADPAMHDAQDRFFDTTFWQPATTAAAALNITQALGIAVVYDSHIHGAWRTIRDRVSGATPPPPPDEKAWVSAYVDARRAWMLTRPQPLPGTVYRMDTFRGLINDGKWDLPLPLTVRGVVIDSSIADDNQPVHSSAETSGERILHLTRPYMTGDDVQQVQEKLNALNFPNVADGIYGPMTDSLVRAFQTAQALTPDGIVGPATRSKLGL